MKTLCVFVVAALLAGAWAQEVLELTSDTFAKALEDNENIMVEFYAPWCGHCKRLAPEYDKAAILLEDKNIRLAKVDCTSNDAVCQGQGVSGFPTLKLFRSGQPMPYEGERTAEAISTFLLKKTGPPATAVETAEQLASIVEDATVVVGFFEKKDDDYKTFIEMAKANEELQFVEVVGNAAAVDKTVAKDLPAVKLFRSFASPVVFTDEFSGVAAWVADNAFPVVEEISEKVFKRFVNVRKPITLLFHDTTLESDPAVDMYKEVAQDLRAKFSFATADSTKFKQQLGKFGASGNKIPTAIVIQPDSQAKWPFDETKDFTKENLVSWLENVVSGKEEPFLKSEPIPTSNDGPVKVVVGKNYNSIVLDPTKSVLLEVYAPWCGHCKNIAPTYEKLGEAFQDNKNVVIAKLDGTANDIPIQIKGFPTILLFPANADKQPIEYNGDRSFDNLKSFVENNGDSSASSNVKDEL